MSRNSNNNAASIHKVLEPSLPFTNTRAILGHLPTATSQTIYSKMEEEQVTTTTTEEQEHVEEVQEEDATDAEAVKELDEMFKDRFTEADPAFMAVMEREDDAPPVIQNFLDLRYQRLIFSLERILPTSK